MANVTDEAFRGTPRFELRRRLGAGAFGVVYEAFDRERNSLVALKTLRRTSDEALYRLKQEFRSLADIAHPNFVALYELFSDGQQWFFTMELIDGKTFHDYVLDDAGPPVAPSHREAHDSAQETSPLTPPAETRSPILAPRFSAGFRQGRFHLERLRSSLRQAAVGIHALHRAGKLHRDIKSSNVLVTRTDRVVLLDFGLVTELVPAEGADESREFAGTPAYMSPEQGIGGPISEASDWYSLGVMLYEALTGQKPFGGSTAAIMRDKQLREPRPPRDLVSGVPEDLDRLCCALLHRDPKERPEGEEIVRRLGGEAGHWALSPPIAATRKSPFVGRARELARLREALHEAETGRAVTVAVHGGSGMGKTVLVRHFLDELHSDARVVILAGRCFEREAVPYKALDSLMDGLSRHLKRLPDARAEALLPRDILALGRLFPVLRRVEAVAAARRRALEIQDVQELRRRAFGAFRELMARLAEENSLVLFIDDLHWGDVDSAALLEELVRPPEPPPLLLILAYRSEEAVTSPLLRRLLPSKLGSERWREISVNPLEPAEARNLARALLVDLPLPAADVAEAVARESSGNPFFLSELARSVSADGTLIVGESEGGAGDTVTLDHVIRSRIGRLSPGARHFLELVAVAGGPVPFSVAMDAAEADPQESVIEVLRIHHLIRTRASEAREEIEIYHDRIRETLVAGLSPGDLKAHHRRLALALETSGQADPESLALHWKEAGDFERAAEYAVSAARQAAETLAFDRAARLFLLALELSDAADSTARRGLRVNLGDALAKAGRGVEAASAYLGAARQAPTAEGLELQRRAAEQLVRTGLIDEGLPLLRSVLEKVGFRYPTSSAGSILSFLYHRLLIRLRGLRFRQREASRIAPDQLIRIDTCWSVSQGLSMTDTLRGRDFQGKHLLLALRAGEPYRIARAVANEAGYLATGGPPNARRTAALLQMATELATAVGHPQALGIMQLATGITAFAEGRWKTAWERAEKSEAILRERCTGVAWELDTTHIYSLRALYYLGRLAEVSARLPALLRDARDRDDLFAETSLRARHSYVPWLAGDEPRKARSELHDAIARWSSRAFYMQHYYALISEADIALYLGEGGEACRIVRDRRRALKGSRLLRIHHLRIEWLHLQARSAIAAAAAAGSSEKGPLLREASAAARRLDRERTPWGSAMAALARAGVASVSGDREKAIACLSGAADTFDGADMALYSAVARLRRGEIDGADERGRSGQAAVEWIRGQNVRNPAGFARMLAPGRWES